MVTLKEKLKDIGAVILLWLMMAWEDIKDIFTTVIVTLLVVTLINTFFFKIVVVSGTSMYPTIKSGSIGFSNIISRKLTGIERFDIVVINAEDRGKNLIKRVIGLPNETITYSQGKLYINDQEYSEDFLDQDYIISQTGGAKTFTGDFTYTLGSNEYFCMGDNRMVSADSRIYGPFTEDEIIATNIFVIYPFGEFGIRNGN